MSTITEAAARLVADRVHQGLPARITDATTLSRIASLMSVEVAPARRPHKKIARAFGPRATIPTATGGHPHAQPATVTP